MTTITTSAIFTIGPITDNMIDTVSATIYLSGTNMTSLNMTLWSGQDYINIGNWTNDQAISRITSLLNSGAGS